MPERHALRDRATGIEYFVRPPRGTEKRWRLARYSPRRNYETSIAVFAFEEHARELDDLLRRAAEHERKKGK